tara:strand:+ start:3333 stop:4961 length:1629 start_codon:yes stop_codon:yes gene_type:complete
MKLCEISPGKNIIKLNIDLTNEMNGSGKIIIRLTNSSDEANSIFFYNKNDKKVLKTNVEYCFWYNEISDSIDISCYTKNLTQINIIYYSNSFKKIEYSVNEIQKLNVDSIFNSGNYVDTLDIFEEKMEKRFKTNREKIHKLVKDELSNKIDQNSDNFPLSEKTYDHKEINAMIDVLLSDKLTMGKNVEEFEKQFADYIGSNYAIMVNSGSSANLLAMAVLSNFKFNNGFKKGDKVIVPTICWSTSVWPIIQMGLEPVFVDINIDTLNADIDKIENLLQQDNKIRGMVVVHILGNTTNMNKLMELKDKYNLILMEDTCESLGSKYNDKFLGTFGECGTYSFYFSHHITTVEGGMVVTDDFEIYELLKCLRAHGWSRDITGYNENSLDNRFCFINVGYNLRPTEIQAAMGLVQLKRLPELNKNRISNYERIIESINKKNNDILITFTKEQNSTPAWFALPFIINSKYNKDDYLKYLEQNNISTRPVVTGNFSRQPVFKDLKLNINPEIFTNAEIIHNQGFFIGLPSYLMTDEKINKLVNILLTY